MTPRGAIACLLAFLLGVGASRLLPEGCVERSSRVFERERPRLCLGQTPPREVRQALQEIARAEEKFASQWTRHNYGTLHELAEAGYVSSSIASGRIAHYSIEVTTEARIPSPCWIARVGNWVTDEHGRLFEIPCRVE
jgi:hypothetical protein